MNYLLDSNVCITMLRAERSARSEMIARAALIRRRIDEADLRGEEVFVCSPVHFELFTGAEKSQNPQHSIAKAATLLAAFRSLPFDNAAARQAASIRAALESTGTTIGPMDLLIAGIANSNGLTLVTNNTTEFRKVTGLTVEDWQQP